MLEYESADAANHVLSFRDLASGPLSVIFSPVNGLDPNVVLGTFQLVVGGSTFKGFVMSSASTAKGPYPLSLDLDGSGAIDGGVANVIVRGGGILDIGANPGGASGSITASLSTLDRNFRDSKGPESLEFTLSTKNGQVSVGGIKYYRNGVLRTPTSFPPFDLYSVGGSRQAYGATDYGVLIEYLRPSAAAEELTMDYPGLGPCTLQLSQLTQAPAQTPQESVSTASCQDSDGFDPYTKGAVSGVDSAGKMHSVQDICQTASDIVVEGLCNNGKPDLLRFRCLNGCKDGACIPRESLFDGATWFCLDDAEKQVAEGCHSEKGLFGEASDYCAKNCKSLNCRIKSLDLGAVCESVKPQLVETPGPKQVGQPVENPAEEVSSVPAPESIQEKKENPKPFWQRVWGWFASIFG